MLISNHNTFVPLQVFVIGIRHRVFCEIDKSCLHNDYLLHCLAAITKHFRLIFFDRWIEMCAENANLKTIRFLVFLWPDYLLLVEK